MTGVQTCALPIYGSANVTAAGTLATVNANVGSFTNASITVNGKGLITAASSGTAPVTSVTGTSPVVSSGGTTPAISLASGYGDTQNPYASKTANYFLSAPNGTAGAPTFRAIVAADIPTLNQNTTGTAANITATSNSTLTTLSSLSLPGSQVSGNISGNAANVTGTVAIANGGTGQTTKTAAYDALNPNTTLGDIAYRDSSNNVRLAGNTTTTKKFLTQTGNGTVSAAPAWGTLVAGDVPTLNQNTTGSAATLTTPRAIYGNNFDGSAALTQIIASTYGGTGNGFTKFSGATTTEKTYTLPDATCSILTSNTAVTITQGGTGQTTASAAFNALSPVTSTGDLIIGNGVNSSTRLAIGTNGYVLTSNGTTATWSAISGTGTVTSVNVSGGTTGLTTSGGPVTTSGTITLAGTLAIANGGTGQTTANAAFNALAPSQTSNSGKYLTTDGTNTSWATVASSTTNAYAYAWFIR